ncbi:MAG: hypothetical protein HDR14_09250 [Lachnospiraceae bacterium]|nr:hypothetical protein [Lachnospiraceae bacterium]
MIKYKICVTISLQAPARAKSKERGFIMTDNEKRAHDIAVSMLPVIFQQKMSEIASGKLDNNGIEPMDIYDRWYQKALDHFEKNN